MQIMCFGDSNTFGYDPSGCLGGRYPADCRWTDLLAKKSGWEVRNNGMNGRMIPRAGIQVPGRTDLLLVMLGTNDLLQGADADAAADRMEKFLKELNIAKEKILLIAPPPMKLGAWVPDQGLAEASVQLAECYRKLAERIGVRFADVGAWNIGIAFDGVHFTGEGHRAFAAGIYEAVKGTEA